MFKICTFGKLLVFESVVRRFGEAVKSLVELDLKKGRDYGGYSIILGLEGGKMIRKSDFFVKVMNCFCY